MASKGDLASETNLHCVRRSFKSFLGDGEGGGGGRGVAERGIRFGKRVLHDLALTLLFHDSASRTFFIAFPNPVFCPSPK